MPEIPSKVNGVIIEFSPSVNKSVDSRIILALKFVIKIDLVGSKMLNRIYISSANDQHQPPSRHVQGDGKAVDISQINGMKMSIFYNIDPVVTAITNAIQNEFEQYPYRRENFGPSFRKKLGRPSFVSGHRDHIHFSVN